MKLKLRVTQVCLIILFILLPDEKKKKGITEIYAFCSAGPFVIY